MEQLVQLAGERRLQDAQVTHDPVAFPGSHQSYPWMTLPSWTIPRPVSLNASSHGDDEGPLIQAIRSGDADKVRDIMMSVTNPRSLMGPNKDGWTPLHEAAYYGQIDCLTILLAAAPWMINSKTLKNQTPLILAVSRGHLACMKYLLKNGADPGIPTTSNDTPLYEACATFNVQMVQLLVQYGADVNQKCLDGWTVLHEAVTQNNQEICEILLDYGAMVCSPNLYGVTPLFLAAQCGCVKVLKFLLKNGADINSEAKDGATALYEACRNGHTEIVELLLSQSADANRPGKDGLLPLHVAAKGGSDGIVSMLIPTTSKTKIQQSGISPLHLAAENDEDDVLELLIQADFEINAVLAPKHSHMYEDRRITALYFAVDNSNIEAATMLLEAGADPNLDPFNPLLLAVRKDHVEMATLLMEHGANVNASIPTHPTTFPACVMLSVRNLTMLKCVMDHGGDAIACFQCEYSFKQHPNMDFTYISCELQYRPQMATHSCLQFCEMISHPMVNRWAGPMIDLLLDYVGHVKLCSRLNEQLEIYDSWAHIKEKSTLPKCLMQLCRLRIRQLMGTERLKYISTLPLPRRLIEYLNFKQQK
ncbi:ankyrin repeat and SOCS box protein 2-like isoform X7 [Pygocentrus nattereri]|uniref:ankyrin repeat and SOCS box protein 2-like isoform X7 n=1 Tax=Pygocentrus nattereri TaxID=42514 RepID=UPI0008142FEE|nr:ankyrin repeat and SOCS box protein 2-like isoform X7 [Pygocentrus nattereri]